MNTCPRPHRRVSHGKLGLFLALLSLGAALAGCTTKTYEVQVQSRSEPEKMIGKDSYRIVTRNRENDPSSLRHKEAEEQIRTALSGIGMYEAPDPADADMVVEIDYGISPPKEILIEYEEPIFVEVPGRVRYVSQTIRQPDGRTMVVQVPVYEPPRQVYAGTQTRVKPTTVYDKYLTITGLNVAKGQPGSEGDQRREPIWSVNVSTQNESDDLREHIPVMVAASLDYIGTTTDKEQKVKIKGNDEDIAFIKAGYSEEGPFQP